MADSDTSETKNPYQIATGDLAAVELLVLWENKELDTMERSRPA
jgi:hypothetical protein